MTSNEEEALQPEVVTTEPQVTAVIAGVIPAAEIRSFYDSAFSTIPGVLASQGVSIVGAPFGRYNGPPGATFDLEVGFPVDAEVKPEADVRASTLPGGKVARLVHAGGFEGLGDSWGRLGTWIGEQDLIPSRVFWEVYLTEPTPDTDPADLRTELDWLVET